MTVAVDYIVTDLSSNELEAGTGDNIEVQKIPPPILLDAQATFDDRTSLVKWLLAGIDVVTPPAMVTVPFINDPVHDIDGLHPFWQDAFDNEGGVLGLRLKINDEGSGLRWASYRSSAYATEEDRPTWIIDYHVPIFVGYNIYLSPGVAPNPVADQPVATVDSLAVSAVLDMAALGLVPNVQYFGAVSPFNTVGRAVTSAPFGFRTDGAGLPLLVPSPVTRVTAAPLVGGDVRVGWTYDEHNPIAVAGTFEIEVSNDTSSFPFSVPHVAPGRRYTRDLTIGSDGLFQVRVKSDKGGLSQANVSPIPVMLDATPPAVVPVMLSAME